MLQKYNTLYLAGPQGFEPRLTESKSVVLPLHYGPTELGRKYRVRTDDILGVSEMLYQLS